MDPYLAVGIMFGVAATLAATITGFTFALGPRRPSPAKLEVYECGLTDITAAPTRYPVRFLQVAMLFLIFDVEAVAFYPLAVMMRRMGAAGLGELGVFLVVLIFGYAYAWRKGAFRWT